MGWLDRLFKTQPPAPAAQSASSSPDPIRPAPGTALPTQPAQLALLAKFLRGADPAEVAHPGWDNALGEPAISVIQRFQRSGWLVDAPPASKLDYAFKVPELKAQLKARSLPVSGKKDLLISRLLEADPQGIAQLVGGVPVWICSPEATILATDFKEDRQEREDLAHATAFQALTEGRAGDAAQAIIAFERTEVLPRGMGIDWHSEGAAAHMKGQANAILKVSPGILSGVPPEEMPQLRAIAAMQALTGESRSKRWLHEGLRGHPTLDIETAVRMLLFAGTHIQRLAQMRQAGIKEVKVMHLGEYSCEACQQFGDQIFSVDKAPELPHPGCTHEMGCRCGYEPMLDFG